MIPKPGHPGKFRLIQNFSFPHNTSLAFPNPSINDNITTEHFPCTWDKFSTVYLLISRLPPGSEAATRDVAEAYRTISLHLSQWPAAIVKISDALGCIDTCATFGASPSCGAYGIVADMGTKILRCNGIGPLDKWVDDHIFLRIPCTYLDQYNKTRRSWHKQISRAGRKQTQSRIWFEGLNFPDGSVEEFSKDCGQPIRDLFRAST